MLPGRISIRRCSACGKPIEQSTIHSGNTFGAKFWTDGKREAPNLPEKPWLVICPHCHVPLWIDELAVIGEIDPWDERNGEFKEAIAYTLPSIDDYFLILESGIGTPEKERYIRLRTWWACNDVRRSNEAVIPISDREAINLTAFTHMLDESDASDFVMKAEIMRELGRFDDARALLARSFDSRISRVADNIKSLAEKCDPYVREIHF